MKIAIFHTEFAYSGGAEKVIFKQMDGLARLGHQVVCYAGYVDKRTSYPDEIKNYDIQQIAPQFLNRFVPHDLIIVLTTLFMPFYSLRLGECDIFMGENQAGPWWAFIAARSQKKPYVTWQPYPSTITYPRKIDKNAKRNSLITQLILSVFEKPIIYFDKLVIQRSQVSFACGEYAANVLEKVYSRSFINCPSGTDIKPVKTQNIFKIKDTKIKRPYILITNRHFPAKRFDYGVQLLRYLSQKGYPSIELVITGAKTEYTNVISDLAHELGVLSRVKFTGYVSEINLQRLYSNALLYLYTASEEDFGMGVVEAMSCGVPVVAWSNAGPKYIIKNSQDGFLAKLEDTLDFNKKCLELIKNKDLHQKISINAKKRAQDFTWEKHVNIIVNELQKYVTQ